MDKLQLPHNKAAKIILSRPNFSSSHEALSVLGWKSLRARRKFHRSSFMFNSFSDFINFKFSNLSEDQIHAYNTTNKFKKNLSSCKTNWGQCRSSYKFIKEWNDLPEDIKTSSSFQTFKRNYWSLVDIS
jgi:hypothetical protein